MVIRLDGPPPAARATRRLRSLLAAPASTLLVLAVGVVVPAASWLATRSAPSALHSVQVGVSVYPAAASARWRDRQGGDHTLDPWSGTAVRVPASQVFLAVAAPPDGEVQCTLTVDSVVDTDAADRGGVALCAWDERR